ncbi:uncharacterized protein LY89DRAFT_786255 [Mollisia scopiformis]|uniref:Chorismate synthase protein n=1 Tax=Mollisia scopiformis TaxID=149040 RepID=A0A194WVX9_MOLSC|nr:uncharacterized protein LY89DRAFT_786255 [Mollisia scopiformis]KUJ12118.1 hypothetical protein LY89DRAFT_786255 [Mollisia scopiformis]
MTITWGTVKSLLLFFGPILLPKAIAYYRSVRAAPSIHGIPIRPIPPAVQRALLILLITSLSFLIRTLPNFAPENIFAITASRLQIPTDVLFTRLSGLRPQGLSPTDQLLRTKIGSLEGRLQYFRFGPDVLSECQFCNPDDPNSYLYYALPGILIPHIFNLCVLALVTSGLFTGKEGAIWRTTGTIAAIAVAIMEVYFVSSYNYQGNSRATRVEDLDFFYWKMRIYRGVALAALDGILGWVLYLSSTNRAFLTPPSTAERIETSSRILDMARSKMGATGVLRNTIVRNEALRGRSQDYWIHEGQVTRAVMEEREVVQSVQNALENRINIATISADADTYAQNIMAPLQAMQQANGAT